MPSMANIIVKKNDGTTDVTYTAQVPSAGDKSPAIWRSLSVGNAAAHRPQLSLNSYPNGPGTARRVQFSFGYPSLTTGSDGKLHISDRAIIEGSVLVPQGMPDVDLNEAISQGCNLLASTLLKDCFKQGFAPT